MNKKSSGRPSYPVRRILPLITCNYVYAMVTSQHLPGIALPSRVDYKIRSKTRSKTTSKTKSLNCSWSPEPILVFPETEL
jgi:hypothetical protein